MQRHLLRRQLRQQRNSLSLHQQQQAAQQLYLQLVQQPVFQRARHLAFYLASDGEISPHLLLQAAVEQGRQVYLPVLAPWPLQKMVFQQIDTQTRWEKNRFGIRQPVWQPEKQREVWTLDLLCMPLVGFDSAGGRLGMGGGFYDRLLAAPFARKQMRMPFLAGLAHSCQQVACLALHDWDIPLHAVVTDREFIRCAPIPG